MHVGSARCSKLCGRVKGVRHHTDVRIAEDLLAEKIDTMVCGCQSSCHLSGSSIESIRTNVSENRIRITFQGVPIGVMLAKDVLAYHIDAVNLVKHFDDGDVVGPLRGCPFSSMAQALHFVLVE